MDDLSRVKGGKVRVADPDPISRACLLSAQSRPSRLAQRMTGVSPEWPFLSRRPSHLGTERGADVRCASGRLLGRRRKLAFNQACRPNPNFVDERRESDPVAETAHLLCGDFAIPPYSAIGSKDDGLPLRMTAVPRFSTAPPLRSSALVT